MDTRLNKVTLVLCCFVVSWDLVDSSCRDFLRRTDNLREVVIGKCETFQQTINQDVFCIHGFRNCTEIWEKFSTAFQYKPLCDVPESSYDDYAQLTDHPVPRDKLLLWENVYPFVHRYSYYGQKYYTLSDTLTGYIGNGPYWCSDPNTSDGMAPAGTLCPGWLPTPDCPRSAVHAFWATASKRFAEKASGEVQILMNASAVPIFEETTYLAEHELPYLRPGIVTKVVVLLVNESPVMGKSKCGDASLQTLSNKMHAKGFEYACVENRRDVADLLCLQDPSLGLCTINSHFIIG